MDLVNISTGSALVVAMLGYAVVFVGLIILLAVIAIMGKVMTAKDAKAAAAVAAAAPVPAAVPAAAPKKPAPGSAGDIKLYDTEPAQAAMVMAIVADTLGKPINELRFKSIREVKE